MIQSLAQICYLRLPFLYGATLPLSYVTANISIYDTISELFESLHMSEETGWQASYTFQAQRIFTDEGICFSFNALKFHEMYTDE